MSRTVFCRKYQKDMKGLDFPVIPGPAGQDIFDNVSEQAWKEWQQHQTMIINERQLNLMNPQDREYLKEQMEKFLSNESFEQAEGYVPPTK